MRDLTHLDAIRARLERERERLSNAATDGERAMRAVWVRGAEKELAYELQFLDLSAPNNTMSDDELLAELMK